MSNTKELIESNSSAQNIVANLSENFPVFRARDWSWEMKSYSGNPNDKMIYGTSPTEPSWIGFGWNSHDSELIAMYGDGHPKDFDIRDTENFDSWDELTKFLKKKNINPDRSLLSKLEREVKSKTESAYNKGISDRSIKLYWLALRQKMGADEAEKWLDNNSHKLTKNVDSDEDAEKEINKIT